MIGHSDSVLEIIFRKKLSLKKKKKWAYDNKKLPSMQS